MKAGIIMACMLLGACVVAGGPQNGATGAGQGRMHEKVTHGSRTLVAAFNDGGALVEQYPEAEMVKRYGEVTLWRLAMNEDRWRHLERIGKYSPVFGQDQGLLKALPGGVVVRLKPQVESGSGMEWFRSRGYPARQLAQNTWLVETQPGKAALETAGRLAQLPQVASAEPNWWQAYSLRN